MHLKKTPDAQSKRWKQPYAKIRPILEEFMACDEEIMELVGAIDHYIDVKTAQSSISGSIKRAGLSNRMRVCNRGNKVFLVKIIGENHEKN